MKTGDLAYYDCFLGLLPCKVTQQLGYGFTIIKFTSNRSKTAYKKGKVETVPSNRVVARKDVHVRNGKYVIRNTAAS